MSEIFRPAGSIDQEGIRRLVDEFYRRVRQHEVLAPVFDRRIAPESWPEHLERIRGFWQGALLRSGDYDGRPLPPHLAMPELSDEHFRHWLALFRQTAREVFDEAGAVAAIGMAERIAQSFRMAVAFHRGRDASAVPPLPGD